VFINIAIIIMDMALLGMECASLYLLETVAKGVCYSIKLKLEFAILSRLVKFVGGGQRGSEGINRGRSIAFLNSEKTTRSKYSAEENGLSDFVDMTSIATDVTYASQPPRTHLSSAYGDDIDLEFARFQHVESANWKYGGENRRTGKREITYVLENFAFVLNLLVRLLGQSVE
jgi:hypothetical protein